MRGWSKGEKKKEGKVEKGKRTVSETLNRASQRKRKLLTPGQISSIVTIHIKVLVLMLKARSNAHAYVCV